MSHVSKFDCQVTDLEALKKAAEDCGLELVENQKTYKWYGRSVGDYPIPAGFKESDLGKCDHALRIPGNREAYEIGVVKSKTGTGYELLWDFWAGGHGLTAKVGQSGDRLKQAYQVRHTERHWQRKGCRTQVIQRQDGFVELKVRG